MPQDSNSPGDVTQLLQAWQGGDGSALNALLPVVYPKLHSIAESFMRRERHAGTLQATGLVHELYLALLQKRQLEFAQRAEFFAFAAWVMRMILREHARSRATAKRGADGVRVPLSEDLHFIDVQDAEQMIDIDRALDELQAFEPRGVLLLQLKTFLGCSTAEASNLAGVSRATADRDLRFARAWLFERLNGGLSNGSAAAAAATGDGPDKPKHRD